MSGEAAGTLADSYVSLTTTGVEGQLFDSRFQVSGVVQNTSAEQVANSVSVIATTYDAEGLVTGFRWRAVEIEDALAPGATAPFTLSLDFHGATPADFSVIAVGRR